MLIFPRYTNKLKETEGSCKLKLISRVCPVSFIFMGRKVFVIKSYIINLDRHPERLEIMNKRFADLGIPYQKYLQLMVDKFQT